MSRKTKRRNYGWLHHIVYVVYLFYCRLRFGRNVRLIPLSTFLFTLVDKEDYAYLSKFKWRPHYNSGGIYAACWVWIADKKISKHVFMQRIILNAPSNLLVDHENHHTLDNRRSNLRLATHSQNCCNHRKSKSPSYSKFKGVELCKPPKYRRKHWLAYINFNRHRTYLGSFPTQIEAALAYDNAARKYHGQFACLNFPKRSGSPKGVLLWIRKLGTHLFLNHKPRLRLLFARLRTLPGLLTILLHKTVTFLKNLTPEFIRGLLKFTANRRI